MRKYKPTKLELAKMALVMANGFLWQAKEYAKGEYIREKTWKQAKEQHDRP